MYFNVATKGKLANLPRNYFVIHFHTTILPARFVTRIYDFGVKVLWQCSLISMGGCI